MRAKYINEKFIEDSDPIIDMGIGMEAQLKKFIKDLYDYPKYGNIISMNQNFENDNDLLWIAAKANRKDLIEYLLLIKKADIHHKSDRALRWAVHYSNYDLVEYLISQGADVTALSNGAMEIAYDHKDEKMIDLLKKHGAKIEEGPNINRLLEKFTEDSDPISDLNIGTLNRIKNFLESKDHQYTHKDIALTLCTFYNKYEFVKFLLEEMNAIPSQITFMYAFDKGFKKIYNLLLKYDKNKVWIDWWNDAIRH